MKRLTMQVMISLVLAGCLTLSQADPAAIGTVVAAGNFQLDDAKVSGNATLFEGTTIQTGAAPSEVRLNNGARMSLGAGARGRVYQDRLLLERGESQIQAGGGYLVQARSLKILSEGGASSARIALAGQSKVQVAALTGALRVTNSKGILVARVMPGAAIEFEPQAAGAAAPSRLSGCLVMTAGKYLLTDETTNVTAELKGSGLQTQVGNWVEISGAMDPSAQPAADASQSIKVTAVKRLAKGCSAASKAKAAAAAGAAARAGAGAAAGGTGIGIGATVAIVGGVAAAATVGGLAAAEKLPGQGNDTPSASR